ncbi:MAG: MotA/TolQ/ExbB proton channel family protein [Candidatus Woesearchaeota archaeon]
MRANKKFEIFLVLFLSVLSFGANIIFFYLQWNAFINIENLSYIISGFIYLLFLLATGYNLKKYFGFDVVKEFQDKKIMEGNIEDINYEKSKLQNYFDELNNNIQTLNSFSKVSIVVGFLGTLVGLVFALSSIKTSLDSSNTSELLSVLNKTLAGLFIAFNTSIGGILTSIALAYTYARKNKEIITEYLNIEQKILEEEKSNALVNNEKAEKRWNLWQQKFELYEGKVNSIKTDILNLSEPLTKAVGNLSDNIVSTLDEKFRQSIKDFKETVNKMRQTVDEMPRKITDELNKMIGAIQIKYDKISNKLNKQIEEAKNEVEKQLEKLRELYDIYEKSLREGVESRVNEIKEALKSELAGISIKYDSELNKIKTSIDGFISQVENLVTFVNKYPELIEKHLNDFNKEIIEKEKGILSNIEIKISKEITDKLVNPSQQLINDLIEGYKKEIIATIQPISELSKNLATLSNKLESTSQNLPQTLEKLEGNLKKWQDNIENYGKLISSNTQNIDNLNGYIEEAEKSLKDIKEALRETSRFLESISKSINDLAKVVEFRGNNEKKNI